MSENFLKKNWQKLSESVLAGPTDELFLPFFKKLFANAEATNDMIKSL
jgi:hypothetical protein